MVLLSSLRKQEDFDRLALGGLLRSRRPTTAILSLFLVAWCLVGIISQPSAFLSDKKDGHHQKESKSGVVSSGEKILIFGAGQGTTGTRTLSSATCKLGLPTVHYTSHCAPKNASKEIMIGIKANKEAIKAYNTLQRCCTATETTRRKPMCTLQNLTAVVETMKDRIDMVIDSGILTIHDTPYPFFLNYTLKRAEEKQVKVMLIATERNPAKWTTRRLDEHPHATVCKEYFEFDRLERHEYGALDMEYCHQRALQRDPPPKYLNQVITTYGALKKSAGYNVTKRQQLIRMNEIALEQYQRRVRQLSPIYVVNFWKRRPQLKVRDVAREIKQAIGEETLEPLDHGKLVMEH